MLNKILLLLSTNDLFSDIDYIIMNYIHSSWVSRVSSETVIDTNYWVVYNLVWSIIPTLHCPFKIAVCSASLTVHWIHRGTWPASKYIIIIFIVKFVLLLLLSTWASRTHTIYHHFILDQSVFTPATPSPLLRSPISSTHQIQSLLWRRRPAS